MELSIRDAKAHFAEAAAAAARGERVVVTKHGQPFIEMVPARKRGLNFEAGDKLRKELGLENLKIEIPDYFDDPAYSRKVLGLDDE